MSNNISVTTDSTISCPTGRKAPGEYKISGTMSYTINNNSDSSISVTISFGVSDDLGGSFTGSDEKTISANSSISDTKKVFYKHTYPDQDQDYIVKAKSYINISGDVTSGDDSSCAFVITA